MSITDYLTNGLLVLLVVRQIHGRKITPWSLIWPLGLVLYFGHEYLNAFPTAGNDLWLSVGGPLVGVTLGALCGLFTKVAPVDNGLAYVRAGIVAASLWIIGTGSRLAFEIYATHGGGASIGRFSVHHDITTMAAWTTGLVLMAICEVLGRNGVIAWRAYQVHQHRAATLSGTDPASDRVTSGSGIMDFSDHAA